LEVWAEVEEGCGGFVRSVGTRHKAGCQWVK
jgi:hypothetical protein